VKFMFVIFYFMHLRWDKPFCTILFFIGLVLTAGTMWALLTLFGAEASIPLPT
jgi:cytochrome c oxidase subunit IV